MFKSKKHPYALFMGHLALEKLLKALVVRHTKAHAPLSHSLPYLAEKSGMKIPEEILVKLREFMEFHFEARYPDVTKAFYEKAGATRGLRPAHPGRRRIRQSNPERNRRSSGSSAQTQASRQNDPENH